MLLRTYLPWLGFAAVLGVAPVVDPSSTGLLLFSQIGIGIILALAYNMLLGQGGMLSFGHAVYFGLAGFSVVHIIEAIQNDAVPAIPLWLMPILGGLCGMVFAIAIGYVSTKRAGTIFAMISLGFAEMVTALVLILVAFFGGEEGLQTNRVYSPDFFGLVDWTQDIQIYYLIAAWAVVAAAAMYAITKTPLGRISNAVRDNPERVAFVGYNTRHVRWFVFSLSGFFAGLAGALHSISFEQAGFDMVTITRSGSVLIMAYIGGAGHFAGPVIGAVLVTGMENMVADWSKAWPVYLGLFFMVVVMFAPGGIAGILQIHERIWKVDRSLMRGLVAPYLRAISATLVALAGAVALVELLHRIAARMAIFEQMKLLWIPVDAHAPWAWLVAAVLLVLGVQLCRKTYPGVRGAYDTASKHATERSLK